MSTRWLTIASLVAAGAAVNMGCSSSSSNPGDAGMGGHDAGSGSGGHVGTDAGTDTQVVHLVNYTFNTGIEGWMFSTYADLGSRNLTGIYPAPDGGADAGDAGAAADAGGGDAGAPPPTPTLEFDGTTGNPAAGSLKITVTFTDCHQYVDPGINLARPAAGDLRGVQWRGATSRHDRHQFRLRLLPSPHPPQLDVQRGDAGLDRRVYASH
jgi:hypothetical protein